MLNLLCKQTVQYKASTKVYEVIEKAIVSIGWGENIDVRPKCRCKCKCKCKWKLIYEPESNWIFDIMNFMQEVILSVNHAVHERRRRPRIARVPSDIVGDNKKQFRLSDT